MTRLRSLIKEVLSTPPKKKDCGCGCNDCDGKAPIITEGRIKKAISEGLTYHIENKIPLHESVYRIGSEKHFALINEARKLWVRGLIDVSEDDQAILETHLGHFGLYEGVEVPLDLPMVNEEKGRAREIMKDLFGLDFEFDYTYKPEGDKIIIHPEGYNPDGTLFDMKDVHKEKIIRIFQDKMPNADAKPNMGGGITVHLKESLNEGFYSSPSDLEDSGLNVIPKNEIHFNKLKDALRDSSLYAEENEATSGREGYFFFPEEEDGYDQLEMEIQELMDDYNIQGYIEGVFEESLNEVHKLLRQTNLSSEEYQKAKKLKGFNADDYTFSSDNNLYVKKSSLDEAMVDYDFSKEELIRVIKQLKSGASGEIGMIKAFEKALGRELTDDEIRGFKIDPSKVGRASLEETISEWPKELTSRYSDEYRFELEKVMSDRAKYRVIDIESGELKGTPVFGTPESLMDFADDLIKPQGGTQSTNLGESLEERIVNILEAKKKKEKKDPPLNKPKRGGSKAYYVYVRDPKTKKIKKVSFGSGGLRAKIKNKQARNAFAARHNCKNKKDRTKAGYWSCNLPRYADQLGLGSKMNTFW